MRIISILNFKGGTGKSSLAENLAHALTLAGCRVLVIDADRQGNASSTLLGKPAPAITLTQVLMEQATLSEAIVETREGLYLVPSDTNLDKASKHLTITNGTDDLLRDELAQLAFDYVFFDHAGAYSPVMHTALLASQEMLVPCELEPYATQGLFSMFDKLKKELRKHTIRNAGIIPYNVDLRYSMARLYLTQLRETFGDLVTSVIRTDSTVPRSQSVHQTVFEYDPKSRVAEDFKTLAEDLQEVTQ